MDWIWSWSDFVFYGFCSCSGNNKTTDKTTDFINKQRFTSVFDLKNIC